MWPWERRLIGFWTLFEKDNLTITLVKILLASRAKSEAFEKWDISGRIQMSKARNLQMLNSYRGVPCLHLYVTRMAPTTFPLTPNGTEWLVISAKKRAKKKCTGWRDDRHIGLPRISVTKHLQPSICKGRRNSSAICWMRLNHFSGISNFSWHPFHGRQHKRGGEIPSCHPHVKRYSK